MLLFAFKLYNLQQSNCFINWTDMCMQRSITEMKCKKNIYLRRLYPFLMLFLWCYHLLSSTTCLTCWCKANCSISIITRWFLLPIKIAFIKGQRDLEKNNIYYFYSLAGVPIVYALQKHCKKLTAEFLLKTQIYCQIMLATLKVSLQELGSLK